MVLGKWYGKNTMWGCEWCGECDVRSDVGRVWCEEWYGECDVRSVMWGECCEEWDVGRVWCDLCPPVSTDCSEMPSSNSTRSAGPDTMRFSVSFTCTLNFVSAGTSAWKKHFSVLISPLHSSTWENIPTFYVAYRTGPWVLFWPSDFSLICYPTSHYIFNVFLVLIILAAGSCLCRSLPSISEQKVCPHRLPQ